MLKFLGEDFSNDLSIDLGTANTLIYVKIKASFLMSRLWLQLEKEETATSQNQ